MIIDAHQHFWKYDPKLLDWINDSMKILQKDFLPADLYTLLQGNSMDGCVAVQAAQSEKETNFLIQLAEKNDFIKGVIGWVDLQDPNVERRLEFYQQFRKLKGFRHIVQDEPDEFFMLKKVFLRGVELLNKYNFTYDILIYPTQLKAAVEIVDQFPEQMFVVDHIAKPYIKKGEIEEWAVYIKKLAAHENVFCKISGMITEADWQNWQYAQFVPYLDIIFNTFGSERIMFGSDWPVCLLAGGYNEVVQIINLYLGSFSQTEKEAVWGLTASKFYQLNY